MLREDDDIELRRLISFSGRSRHLNDNQSIRVDRLIECSHVQTFDSKDVECQMILYNVEHHLNHHLNYLIHQVSSELVSASTIMKHFLHRKLEFMKRIV